jgi:hypothetical protein
MLNMGLIDGLEALEACPTGRDKLCSKISMWCQQAIFLVHQAPLSTGSTKMYGWLTELLFTHTWSHDARIH